MAAANPAESLRDEASCSICLDYFIDPVTIDCGHNFCRSCITQTWERSETDFPCPQCRKTFQQKNLRPNRQLANMVEIAKKLSECSVRLKEENLCEKHEEKLKLFCEDDQRAICVVCDRSRDHRSHTVTPIEEAVQEYKEKLKIHLETLRKDLEDLLKFKSTEEKKAEELKSETEIRRQKAEYEFAELHQLLDKEKQIFLLSLEEEEKKILQRMRENMTQLEQQSFALKQLISEIEEKSQQPANELLKDVKDALSRWQKMKFLEQEVVSTDLKMGLELSYPQQLKTLITKFRGQATFMNGLSPPIKNMFENPVIDRPTKIKAKENQEKQRNEDQKHRLLNEPNHLLETRGRKRERKRGRYSQERARPLGPRRLAINVDRLDTLNMIAFTAFAILDLWVPLSVLNPSLLLLC
ncbi:E3 ubiquitin-protein ligase TRIM39 [Microcaecilia unicolor]|uniref:RING-type E3 ubiquitin transferase n=1 Tax=Microcaecilia unicolor TaxID=1415580 RepID=A0A6P7XSV0_9AMPH|nr:E3 ubiquitin-protein ligase TRIM39-like [Microcaecilia unicolor]